MKAGKFISLFVSIVLLGSCGICNHLPQEHIVVRDSVAVSYRDSVVLHHKTVNRDYVGLLDTLRIQGEHSSMKAFADTSKFTIKGELIEQPYKERIVYKDRIQYKDSIQYVKEPYPVEVVKEKKYVPKIYKWSLAFSIAVLLILAGWIYAKISKADILSLFKKI